VRRLALEALLAAADDRATVVLARTLADPDPVVRRRAVALAGRLLARDHAAAVARRLEDGDAQVRRQAVLVLGALAAPGTARPLLAALPRLGGAEALVAEALASAVRSEDLPALVQAAAASRGAARTAVLTGLGPALQAANNPSAAPGDGDGGRSMRRSERSAIELLAAEVGRGGVSAEVAAEALAAAGAAALRHEAAVRAALATRTPALRARLAPLVALDDHGPAELGHRLSRPHESDEARAAAAWALAGTHEPALRAALERATGDLHPAVAANARAALAVTQPAAERTRSIRVRLVGADARPDQGRWLAVQVPGAGPVWTRTGRLGQAALGGLAGGTVAVAIAPAGGELSLEDAGDGVRQIPGQQQPRP
jgi:hypothetical protein